jgi:hypothetical protein
MLARFPKGIVVEHRFESRATLGRHLPSFSETEIKNEPMLFSCDFEAAAKLGGPLTNSFLANLAMSWDVNGVVIDSRVHMLMPGWFPCIPGWHHDDVPRTRSDGQPNYEAPEYMSEHCMALAGGDICPTQFALGAHELPDVPLGGVFYRNWHPIVEGQIGRGEMRLWNAPSNRLIFFDWESMHQGTQANADGWRWFIRASRNTARKPSNELRRQVQVYMPAVMDGW